MNDAELRCTRERLGLTTLWLAAHLDVAERTVHRWEHGHSAIPAGVAAAVLEIDRRTNAVVDERTRAAAATRMIVTFRTDEDYHAANGPAGEWSASWDRAVAARVASVVDAGILYWPGDPLA